MIMLTWLIIVDFIRNHWLAEYNDRDVLYLSDVYFSLIIDIIKNVIVLINELIILTLLLFLFVIIAI